MLRGFYPFRVTQLRTTYVCMYVLYPYVLYTSKSTKDYWQKTPRSILDWAAHQTSAAHFSLE